MKEIRVPADVLQLETVNGFIASLLDDLECSPKSRMQIDLAVEEIFVNIASYAYAPGTGDAVVRCEILDDPAAVKIEFEDTGTPYNPLEKEDPDVTLSAEERSIGGLGIFMVKKSMDELAYRRENGSNIFSIRKNLRS